MEYLIKNKNKFGHWCISTLFKYLHQNFVWGVCVKERERESERERERERERRWIVYDFWKGVQMLLKDEDQSLTISNENKKNSIRARQTTKQIWKPAPAK